MPVLVALVPASAEASKFDIGAYCDSDVDCAPYPDNPWCDPEYNLCGTCQDNDDCADEDDVCQDGGCVRPCAEDLDCTADAPTCDVGEGHCVMCQDDSECTGSEHCANGTCRPDVCAPGELDCRAAGRLAVCADNGSGWDVLQDCWALGQECVEADGESACVGEGESTGGMPGGATDGADGGTGADGADGSSQATGDGAEDGAADGTGGAEESPAADGCRSGGTTPAAGVLAFLLPVWLRRRAG